MIDVAGQGWKFEIGLKRLTLETHPCQRQADHQADGQEPLQDSEESFKDVGATHHSRSRRRSKGLHPQDHPASASTSTV